MRRSLFEPTIEGEARLLLLIHAFTTERGGLDGRTKLAKLDFFLRYPEFMQRALAIRGSQLEPEPGLHTGSIEQGMVRYRYGPWDPAYFAILGRLQGKGLIETRPGRRGALAYRTSSEGARIADALVSTESWAPVGHATAQLRRHLDLTGSNLKRFIYEHFPEVTAARWGQSL